ncbi:Uncharacterised protein [Campylobacter jejuni subsp. doylei]|uniref:Uncharacterized protein n=1 Tax=Campylobacter jejuni subsp. doylei TaxID=32021 RepID=A0A448J719_CAMJU|nr:Uncharacterised protein [Campylobacter jejuni subsp. doylei]
MKIIQELRRELKIYTAGIIVLPILSIISYIFKTYLGRNPNCFSGWAECQRA